MPIIKRAASATKQKNQKGLRDVNVEFWRGRELDALATLKSLIFEWIEMYQRRRAENLGLGPDPDLAFARELTPLERAAAQAWPDAPKGA